MLVLVIAPFFTSFILRTIAWKQVLADEGPVVSVLKSLHVLGPTDSLTATSVAVVAGITYNFLPFMTLPRTPASSGSTPGWSRWPATCTRTSSGEASPSTTGATHVGRRMSARRQQRRRHDAVVRRLRHHELQPGNINTFPKFVYVSATRGIPPQANVVGTAMFVVALAAVLAGLALSERRRRLLARS